MLNLLTRHLHQAVLITFHDKDDKELERRTSTNLKKAKDNAYWNLRDIIRDSTGADSYAVFTDAATRRRLGTAGIDSDTGLYHYTAA